MSGFFTVKLSKSTYLAGGVLVLALLVIGGMDLQIKKSKARARSLGGAAPAVPEAAAQDVGPAVNRGNLGWARTDGRLEWGADPFGNRFHISLPQADDAPGADEEEVEGTPAVPSLQGIITGPGGKMALINGELMRVGDRLNEIRLLHIGEDYVAVSQSGRSMTLTMDPQQRRGASP